MSKIKRLRLKAATNPKFTKAYLTREERKKKRKQQRKSRKINRNGNK